MSSSSESEVEILKKRKKGVVNIDKYKRNIMKKAKVQGMQHVNYSGKVIPAKVVAGNQCCFKNCLSRLSEEEKQRMLDFFCSLESKDSQDLHLQRLLEIHDVLRKWGNMDADSSKPKSLRVKYFVLNGLKRIQTWKKALLSVYGISKKRCERIVFLLKNHKSPKDMRGKNSSGNTIKGQIIANIRQHIESYPVKSSHYTSHEIHYLDCKLSVKTMYEMFREKHPNDKISYKFFRSHFKENYDLKFGRPAKDTCSTCEELNAKIKSNILNENAKRVAVAKLMVHKRRSKKFYTALDSVKKLCEEDVETLGICIDFMANVSLPQIPVQDLYYFRQLTVCNFGIHNLKSRNIACYVYHEGEAGKGANDVCSFLKHYLDQEGLQNYKKLHVFCDNCSGQNKNNTVVRFLMSLVELKRFEEIQVYFPMRGHSFMPCDRDFGLIKRQPNRTERFYTIQEYIEIISKASKNHEKFSVIQVSRDLVYDYKSWWPQFYKRTCLSNESYGKSVPRSQKKTFSIASFHHLTISIKTEVACREFINCPVSDTFRLRNCNKELTYCSRKAYPEKIPINKKKMTDILNTVKFIPEDFLEFWRSITAWPTTERECDQG